MNITPDTVVNSMKLIQLTLDNIRPDGLFPSTIDVVNDNHAYYTVHKCKTLEFFEREAPDRISQVCGINEVIMIKGYMLNPNLDVEAVVLPPRKSPDEICCKWKITMKE